MRTPLLLVGFLLGCISFLRAGNHPSSDTSKTTPQQIETERKLKSIVFNGWYAWGQHVRGDLRRDVAEFKKPSKALDPAHIGVTFRLAPPDLDYPKLVQKRDPTHKEGGPDNLPLADVLTYLVEVENLDYIVEPDGVVLISLPMNNPSSAWKKLDTTRRLQNIVIDKFDLSHQKKGDLQRDLVDLEKRSKECDPEHRGISLRLQKPGAEYPPSHLFANTPPVKNIPLDELVACICQKANLLFRVEADGVVYYDPVGHR